MKKGTRLNAVALSLLAGTGRDSVAVYQRPPVAVISTGDEVLEPGAPSAPGKIYDSNRYFVAARLSELGCPPVESLHCGDNAEDLARQIHRLSRRCQLILTTGGVSVGERDILHQTLELLGAKRLFWKVAVKPGSPTLAAAYENTLLICLSGNPSGAEAHFELLVRPVMEKLTGSPRWSLVRKHARLAHSYSKGSKMCRYLRGILKDGQVFLVQQNAEIGVLSDQVRSNCYVELPPRRIGFEAGEEVWVYCL
jgi:molybdopterin molybdotransferase